MEVTVIRSNRKTVAIQVNSDLTVIVRAPKSITQKDIEQILKDKEQWIQRNIEHMRQTKAQYDAVKVSPLTNEEIKELADRALKYIPGRVKYYAGVIGVSYGGITIRNQKTRWGSCSSKGNLNFNWKLALMPDEILDYVVVHELAHRMEMNHSDKFWKIVENVLPDYRERRKWLKECRL